jgi:phage head maturation protease
MTKKIFGPPGWARRSSGKRTAAVIGAPASFDAETRSVTAVLSRGSPVSRYFGVEKLRIGKEAVDLSRLDKGGIMVLDSHTQASISNSIGRLTRVWFEGSSLYGRIRFNETVEGERAMGMVGRGEITSVSIGYVVDKWQVRDADGNVLDPEYDRIRPGDDLTFEAVKWRLLEASLVSVPADGEAMIRSYPGRAIGARAAALARMRLRQRTMEMLDD